MVRRWNRLLIISLLLLALPLPAEEHQSTVTGLLWEISAPQMKSPSYLFGTIHSEDERVLALPEAVSRALQQSALYVMEMEPTAAAQQQVNRRMLLDSGEHLTQLLGDALYRQSVEVMSRHGLPEEVTSHLKPWAVMMVLSMPKPRTGLFLDVKLYQSALAQKKRVAGLESADEQIDTLDGMPLSQQIALLRHTLDHYHELATLTEQFIAIWLQRDLVELERLAAQSNAGLESKTEKAVQQRLLDERNRRMAERMVPLLQKQASFVAVGALHLPGDEGLIALLRQRGYTLRPIY